MVSFRTAAIASFVALASASPMEKRATDLGCYFTGALSDYFTSFGFMTNAACASTCYNLGYAYSGTYSGTNCACGNQVQTGPYYDCILPCAGNGFLQYDTCGGALGVEVSLTGYTPPVDVPKPASTSSTKSSSSSSSTRSSTSLSASSSSTSAPAVASSTSSSSSKASSSSSSSSAPVLAPSTSSTFSSSSLSSSSTKASSSSISTIAAAMPSTSSTSTKASTSSSSSAAPVVTPVQSATAVPGYTIEYSGLTAAANGAGYLTSFATQTYDVAGCAAACNANSACAFFNIYQEQLASGAFDNVCVLWSQDQPTGVVNNYYNNGQPISYSAGYLKNANIVSSSSASSTSSSTSAVRSSSTSSIASSTSSTSAAASTTACAAFGSVAGFTQEWSCQNAAADGPGYLSSYVSSAATYSAAVTDCGASCTTSSSCAFFNVYQQNSGSSTVCVLWTQDKPLSSATNVYNNGQPISNSAGFVKNASGVSSSSSPAASTTSSSSSSSSSTIAAAASTSTASSSTSTAATAPVQTAPVIPGYTLEWTGQTSAADGPGYLSSYVSQNYDATACAASCTASSSCAFFNIYQEKLSSGAFDYVCVLWSNDKPLSSATNYYNNGMPITFSSGYLKNINSPTTTSSSSSSASSSATATACAGLAPGYAVCREGQKVQNGVCVTA